MCENYSRVETIWGNTVLEEIETIGICNGRTIKLTNNKIQVEQCRKYESLETKNKWLKYTKFQYGHSYFNSNRFL